jgi:hypothetical protein
MISDLKVRVVLLILAFSVIILSFLFIDERSDVKELQRKNEKLIQEVSTVAEEKAYLVDQVFNLNSQLQKK